MKKPVLVDLSSHSRFVEVSGERIVGSKWAWSTEMLWNAFLKRYGV